MKQDYVEPEAEEVKEELVKPKKPAKKVKKDPAELKKGTKRIDR